jgi:hypothetical protein
MKTFIFGAAFFFFTKSPVFAKSADSVGDAVRSQTAPTEELTAIVERLFPKIRIDYFFGDAMALSRWSSERGDFEEEYFPEKEPKFSHLTQTEKIRQLLPFWIPHFNQILQSEKLSASHVLSQLDSGSLSKNIESAFLAPLSQEGTKSYGFDQSKIDQIRFKSFLIGKIKGILSNGQQKKIKMILGGTLFPEVKNIADLMLFAFHDAGVGIEDWDIQIVAYSIETQYLFHIQQALIDPSIEFPKKWIRTEYIDLLDQVQIQRLKNETPDIVLTRSSLYIGEMFANRRQFGDYDLFLECAPPLIQFVQQIYEALPPGGLFVIEERNYGQKTYFSPFVLAPALNGDIWTHSGFYYKPDGSGNLPASLLSCEGILGGHPTLLKN